MPTDQLEEAEQEDIEVKSKSRTADVMQPIQQVREANTGLWMIQDFIKFSHLFFLQASARVEGAESLTMNPMESVRNAKVRKFFKLVQCFCFFPEHIRFFTNQLMERQRL